MALQIREVNRIFHGQDEQLKAFSTVTQEWCLGILGSFKESRLEDTLLMMSDAHTVLKGASKRIAVLFVDSPKKTSFSKTKEV
jgi:hypothetical protein